ncbi:hypothetical protein [uncultured Bifidobacterium sp.]|uniref:hypothetical protein n=1 Tax=uncultured Bifidobacterium sp. TaxID=165187 RepID=UPI0025903A36|nr:hypothetical protein [uncultured Bifidobacterium sp.]
MNKDDVETFEAMWNMVYADDDDNPEIDFIKTEGITADGRVEEIDLSDLVDDDGTSHYDRYAFYKFTYGIDGKTHEMTFKSSTLDAVAEDQRPYLTYMSEW